MNSTTGAATLAPPERVTTAAHWALLVAFVGAIAGRIAVVGVGAPFITIDDSTAYEAGFLVWFGQAPPQRMYLESWIYGLVSIGVFVARSLAAGSGAGLTLDVVAAAYRDYYGDPGPYVLAYRTLMLLVDLATAWFVYRIGRIVFSATDRTGWLAVLPAILYLATYNTVWSGIVARPDTVVAFFAALGVLLYLRSDHGRRRSDLLWAALALGAAAGMKLHGAVFAVVVCADLLRVHGWRTGFRHAAVLAGVSFAVFLVTAGSPLFDPLTYAKLRYLNYVDDRSPWIEWGDQFVAIARGAGWLGVPLAVVGIICAVRGVGRRLPEAGRTMLLLAAVWIVLFASIRALRPYWMLPALPAIYVAATHAIATARLRSVAVGTAVLLLGSLTVQTGLEIASLRSARYAEVTDWLGSHARDKRFYVFGYDALVLPKNTLAIRDHAQRIESTLRSDAALSQSFARRHLQFWEERASLKLYDMLGFAYDGGFEYYSLHSTPPERLREGARLPDMDLILVQDGVNLQRFDGVEALLADRFVQVGRMTGAGGGARGLGYVVYARR